MRIYTWLCLASLTGCADELTTPVGLHYAPESETALPKDIARQLDAAWRRALTVADRPECGVVLSSADMAFLLETSDVLLHNGQILGHGIPRDGLTWDTWVSEVALLDGRAAATAHELWHQFLYKAKGWDAVDNAHTGPCWNLLSGDTQ